MGLPSSTAGEGGLPSSTAGEGWGYPVVQQGRGVC